MNTESSNADRERVVELFTAAVSRRTDNRCLRWSFNVLNTSPTSPPPLKHTKLRLLGATLTFCTEITASDINKHRHPETKTLHSDVPSPRYDFITLDWQEGKVFSLQPPFIVPNTSQPASVLPKHPVLSVLSPKRYQTFPNQTPIARECVFISVHQAGLYPHTCCICCKDTSAVCIPRASSPPYLSCRVNIRQTRVKIRVLNINRTCKVPASLHSVGRKHSHQPESYSFISSDWLFKTPTR